MKPPDSRAVDLIPVDVLEEVAIGGLSPSDECYRMSVSLTGRVVPTVVGPNGAGQPE